MTLLPTRLLICVIHIISRATHLWMQVTCRLLIPTLFRNLRLEVIRGYHRHVLCLQIRAMTFCAALSWFVALYVPSKVLYVYPSQLRFVLDGEKCGDLRWWVATFIQRNRLWRSIDVHVFLVARTTSLENVSFCYVLGGHSLWGVFYFVCNAVSFIRD